ncbi:MAG TPA: hypothetical protein VJT09_12600 [Pyrinomonadaceae bacterium]|nr:hypothetical protein [Pyrinomonadaceae bacterium]
MKETEEIPLTQRAKDDAADEPHGEYTRRGTARRAEAARQMERFRRVGILRIALLAAALALGVLAFKGAIPWWWTLVPAALFLALGEVQRRFTEARRRALRSAAIYEQGLERLDDLWPGSGATGERFLTPAHPYAEDLDLFGRGSLFELLSRARTRAGEETLANWLLSPAPAEVVRARQAAITELRLMLDLREDLALLGEGLSSGDNSRALTAWASASPWPLSPAFQIMALALALLAVVTLILWVSGFGAIPFLIAFALGRAFAFRFQPAVNRVLGTVDTAGRGLSLLSEVLARLEVESFSSPRLAELRAALNVEGLPASRQIARLNLLIDLLDARRNMIFAPFSLLLIWPLQFAIRIERWRQLSGRSVARWLDAVGELEALSSLAGYAYERPQDPFPELTEGGAFFDGEGLGHPLIPESRNVRTDLRLSDETRVLIVSGSNMSGKSTLLRTVGVNAALAQAGAPVRARRLRLSPLQVGASIRIQDSLQAGASRFYAEIKRLRQIVDLTKAGPPVLFLLDEILHGTNSHDRRIGAEGVVRGLIARGAVGLVTTHDLALARIAEELAPRAANVHFEDHLEDGVMAFDYRLRPGVVERSNALELMRSVGLEV